MIWTVLGTVLTIACAALAVVTVLGTYRELDELRERLVAAEWRLGISPDQEPRVVGVGYVERARRWLRRLVEVTDVKRALRWFRRVGHQGEHRA